MQWNGWSMTPPAQFHDHTVAVWSTEDGSISVTVGFDVLRGPLATYAATTTTEVALQLGARPQAAPEPTFVAGQQALHTTLRGKLEDGRGAWQRQVFVDGGTRVMIVTATGEETQRDDVERALQQTLTQLQLTPHEAAR
jgi:hypothetical protein